MGDHAFPSTLRVVNEELLNFLVNLRDDYDDEVRCDASRLKFLMPVGICALASVCHDLHRRNQRVFFDRLAPRLDSFMERMDVFEHCHVQHANDRSRVSRPDALVEIQRIDRLEDASEIARKLVGTCTGYLMRGVEETEDPYGMEARPSEHLMFMLQYVLVELLGNALTHARKDGFAKSSVWIAANYFPTTGDVRLAFVDNGCGFLQALRRHPEVREDPSHQRAIEAALRPFVSSNKEVGILGDPSNQGMGLTVSTDLAIQSQGGIRITSGTASVRRHYKREYTDTYSLPWQGAMVEVSMRRDALLNSDLNVILSKYVSGPKPKIRFE